MRHFTLLIAVLTLFTGSVQAEAPDFLRILDLVKVEYTRAGTEGADVGFENEGIIAYYDTQSDDITIGPIYDELSDTERLGTLLHELAHWANGRPGRIFALPYLDIIMAEAVAEIVSAKVSAHLYNGEYSSSVEDSMGYLFTHPAFRKMQHHEVMLVMKYIKETEQFLLFLLRNVDRKNELMVK